MLSAKASVEPVLEPVTLVALKAQLKITASDEDDYLCQLISAARKATEYATRRCWVSQTWEGILESVPAGTFFHLAPCPAITISSIKYYSPDGTENTFSSSAYSLDLNHSPNRVILKYGYSWPTSVREVNPIKITWTAGYGTTAASVPGDVRQAIALTAAHWWQNRTPVNIGNIVNEIPDMAAHLLWPYKVLVFGWEE